MKLISEWLGKYSDWRRGISPERRAWLDWSEQTINPRADTVQRVYAKFKYIIEVDPDHFFSHEELGAWIPCADFKQLAYPNKQLGQCAVWGWFRGEWSQQWWNSGFLINDMFGGDHVFVATNEEQDALWIAMKWGK